jgi:hypothetical protein
MSDADTQIQASVVITSDTSGAQRATAALNGVNAAGGKAAATAKQGASSFGSLSEGMGKARESASVLAERLGEGTGVSGVVRILGASIRSFAGGPITVAIVAITSIVSAFAAWRQRIQEVQDASNKLAIETQKLREISMDKAVADYDKLADSINKAASAQDRINEAKLRFMDAKTATQLAGLDLEEAKSLAKINPDATEARKAVTLDFSQRRLAVQNEAAISKAAEESVAAQKKVADGARAMFAAEQALEQEESNLAKEMAIRASVVEASNRLGKLPAKEAAWSVMTGFGPGIGPVAEENARINQERESLTNFLASKSPLSDIDARVASLSVSVAQRKKNRSLSISDSLAASQDVATAEERRNAVYLSTQTASTKLQDEVLTFKEKQTAADLAAQKSAAEAQLPQYQQQAAAAQDYLSTVDSRVAEGTYSQDDQISMQRALASAQEQTALLQSFITRIGAEMSKQNEILRTLPTR